MDALEYSYGFHLSGLRYARSIGMSAFAHLL
jgi:hypothetical protein